MADAQQWSPAWWLDQLNKRLVARNEKTEKFERYYEGNQPLANVSKKYRAEFAEMLRGISDNWMALVVDAVEERLHVDGFRTGGETQADPSAWEIWQRNDLDADSELLHRDSLVTGQGYAMVWWAGEGQAEITIESPCETIVAGSRRRRQAALKSWKDEWTGELFANVYLPDAIWKFQATRKVESDLDRLAMAWEPRKGDETVPNPLGFVPIVEFPNRPRTGKPGRSEIADVLSTQDQINKLVCDMIIASEFAAFRQRWAVGIEIETDEETGEKLAPFKSGLDRLFTDPNPDTKFGEFAATDLGNYVRAIENRVQSLASRTRTPPHYLLGQSGSFPSGESLKSTETGLVAKVKSKSRHYGEAWEEVMRLAGLIEGNDALAAADSAETKWRDPESRTEAEHIDALGKLRTMLNVPLEQLWEDAEYTPQQIGRFRQMLLDEALYQLLGGTPAPVPTGAA